MRIHFHRTISNPRYCNAAPKKRRTEVLIYSDAAYIVLMSVFAISNGYLGNISMIHGPRAFESKQHQGRIHGHAHRANMFIRPIFVLLLLNPNRCRNLSRDIQHFTFYYIYVHIFDCHIRLYGQLVNSTRA